MLLLHKMFFSTPLNMQHIFNNVIKNPRNYLNKENVIYSIFFFYFAVFKSFNLVKVFDKAKVHEHNFHFHFFLSCLLVWLILLFQEMLAHLQKKKKFILFFYISNKKK